MASIPFVTMTQKIYVLEQSKPEQRRNEMQVALHMLQRTTCADGKTMITDSVLDLAQALLITGVNYVPAIETLQKTIRRAKNDAEYLKSASSSDSEAEEEQFKASPGSSADCRSRSRDKSKFSVYGTNIKSFSVCQRRLNTEF